jgi:hypothetical protein
MADGPGAWVSIWAAAFRNARTDIGGQERGVDRRALRAARVSWGRARSSPTRCPLATRPARRCASSPAASCAATPPRVQAHVPAARFESCGSCAQTARAEAEIACGRAYAVIGELETLTAEQPYREPLWAQLITGYYVSERQSGGLEAYRRLKTTLAEDLGIDPGPTVGALHARILRQQPLDTKQAAQNSAASTITNLEQRTAVGGQSAIALLPDTAGRHHRRPP